MKLLKVMAVAVMLICLCVACASCSDKNKDGADEVTTTPAENATERFDYFAVENYSEYVSIEKSAYENMAIELEDKFTVTDEKLEEYIELLLFQNRRVKNNGAKIMNEAIKKGDIAYIFYEGVLLDDDGNIMLDENGKEKKFDGGSNMSSNSPHELIIGSGDFIDGFEDQLIGVIPSETSMQNTKDIRVTFPEDYAAEELAGEEVIFHVCVMWIVQYETPEYNEEFIKETLKYVPTTDDVIAEHKESLRKTLEENFESSKSQEIEATIWDNLYKSATILKLPESEVNYFYESYCKDLEEEMAMYNYYYNYGFSKVDDFAIWYFGLEANADWKAVVKVQAEQAVAQTLIYHAIASQCGIQSSNEAFEATVNKYIEMYKSSGKNYTREEIINAIGEVTIKEGNLYDAVVKYIKDRATVTLKPVQE